MSAVCGTTSRMRGATPLTADLSRLIPSIADHNVANHVTRTASTLGHAKHYYNPARSEVYSRYSTSEWDMSNKSNFNLSEKERSAAERLRSDAWQTVKDIEQHTRTRQASNTRKLGERVHDIAFWKEELLKEVGLMEHETANLREHLRVLQKAQADTRSPLAIAEECLVQREKRLGIDLVHDNVERCLTKEVQTIKKCQNKMQNLIEKTNIQLKMNRVAQKACEADVQDKHHAHDVDDRMYQLRNSSSRLGFFPGIENIDNTITVPVTWVRFTQENIARSQKDREMSERLRGQIDSCIRACANEMWNHFNTVNNALNARAQEINNAKLELQAHLLKTNNEIRDMQRAIDLLRKAIADKEAPMKVAQTRLDERTRRINVELCNDPVMLGLQREIVELRESSRVLRDKLQDAERSLSRLHRTRVALEKDISVKDVSLDIDAKACMGLRKNMAMDPRMGPVFTMPLAVY